MNFEEHVAKPLLAAEGIGVPRGRVTRDPDEAAEIAAELGPVMVKAQVPAGKRGKTGGVRSADAPGEAREAAAAILGKQMGSHRVERVLVEERRAVACEYYAAVLNDTDSGSPLVLFSARGGMDIEELAARHPEALRRHAVDVRSGLDRSDALAMLEGLPLEPSADAVARFLEALYRVYRSCDAELLEVNPLAAGEDGALTALDCKLVIDDSALARHDSLARDGSPDPLTEREAAAEKAGFKYIDLEGDVGVLANGAGLTMTTMDVVRHHGGKPANFLEIGGDAYTRAKPALDLLLGNPGIRSLVVSFCGAFVRTDVMVEGVIGALHELRPALPVFFCVHGTGEEEAVAMLRERLGVEPFDSMDEAVRAAVAAAAGR